MAPANLIQPTDLFDPLEDLLNAPITDLNAEDARLLALMLQPVTQSLTVSNTNFAGVIDMTRVGGTVTIGGFVDVKVANYIATNTTRSMGALLPPGYRPAQAATFLLYGPDVANLATTRSTALIMTPGAVSLKLEDYSAATHAANLRIMIGATFVTADQHPAL